MHRETLGNVVSTRPGLPGHSMEDILRITSRKNVVGGLTLITASALLLAGCAAAPEDTDDAGSGDAVDFLPCMVSDAGGFDDKSFNQLGKTGIDKAAAELGVEPVLVESATETDYAPNLTQLVDQGCDLIVTVGFALSAATVESALANPEVEYVIIDDAADNDFNGETDAPNIKPVLFDTAQAAFLAGYLSAGVTETGKLGTFGGMNFPTVSIFMDGFKQGAEYYNTENGTSVQVLGWDGADGSFTGGFEAGATAVSTAQALIDQDIDVLLPVGGPIYQSAATAIRDSGKSISLLGVDADVFESDPTVGDLLLTSIRKGIDVATYDAVLAAGKGNFDVTPYIGTLENDGVSIADYHDKADLVSADLDAAVKALKDAIIAGDVKVTSYLAG
jgi:basic membrane protein A and related proteins